MTFCMNVSRFMNLAAIFSLDLESQFNEKYLIKIFLDIYYFKTFKNYLKILKHGQFWKRWQFQFQFNFSV